jgi:hypothetical protein
MHVYTLFVSLNHCARSSWPYGNKQVHLRSSTRDSLLFECWYPAASSNSWDEYALILSDQVQVSSSYYLWLRRVAANYFMNHTNSDLHLFGISLQHQLLDAAHFPTPFLAPLHTDQRPAIRNLFRSQLPGTSALLISPTHWRSFRRWYSSKQVAHAFMPTIRTNSPSFLLNTWATTNHAKQQQQQQQQAADHDSESWWLPWLARFMFEHSFYTLFPALPLAKSIAIDERMPTRELGMQLLSSDESVDVLAATPFKSLRELPLYNLCCDLVAHLQHSGELICLGDRAPHAATPQPKEPQIRTATS